MKTTMRRSFAVSTILGLSALAFASPAFAADDAIAPVELDRLWLLLAAALVFFMQAGFLCLEVGLVRPKNTSITALKSVIDWSVVSVVWLLAGFGFAFGHTAGGFLGSDLFFGNGLDGPGASPLGWTFFLFQLGFAGAATAIVTGAMAERVSFLTYLCFSTVNGVFIYPVVAHWAWGNGFFGTNATWLTKLGFHDFAGSTVVHSVGGWMALVGILIIGPRLGRFDSQGNARQTPVYSLPLAALGVFILWLGWWGFNGGSTLRAGDSAALVILKTNLAASVAGFVAYAHAALFQKRRELEGKFLGGVLTGLVAITAGALVVSIPGATAIGALAGIVHNVSFEFLLRKRIDDPVGAVPVHLGGGILGTICVGVFGRTDVLAGATGISNSRLGQIGIQLLGVLAAAVWSVTAGSIVLLLLKKTVGLRVSPRQESDGVTLEGDVAAAGPGHGLDLDELQKKLGG